METSFFGLVCFQVVLAYEVQCYVSVQVMYLLDRFVLSPLFFLSGIRFYDVFSDYKTFFFSGVSLGNA